MPITQEQHLITNIKNHLNTIEVKQAEHVNNRKTFRHYEIGDQIAIINNALDEIGKNLK